MKILVTGAAGFIGKSVVERLRADNHDVIGVDRLPGADVMGDILDPATLSAGLGSEVVIHLAATAGVRKSVEHPVPYVVNNVVGTATVIDWCQRNQVRKLVFASTSSVYGHTTPPTDEYSHTEPISPYAASKLACEELIRAATRTSSLSSTILRLFTVYGPRQRADMAISKMTRAVIEGAPITLFGDGTAVRDFTHVDDVAEAFVLAATRSGGRGCETYNIGSGNPIPMCTVIATISKAVGKPAIIRYEDKAQGDVDITHAINNGALEGIGWKPTIDTVEGITDYVRLISR
jgi:UDP-glucuronate 4-epimerase